MVDNHGLLPTKAIREEYALGIVMLFPSLKDPYSKKGYEHFYDAASSTGYISWCLKTVQRKAHQGSALPPNGSTDLSPGGGLNFQRTVNVERQLDGDACQEAMSLLNHTTDNQPQLIFQKMRETFQHRQNLVNDPGRNVDILSTFPRFLDAKGLPMTKKWPPCCCCYISFHHHQGDQRLQKSVQVMLLRLVVFHKSCCSLEEHLRNQQGQQPYLLAVGCQKSKIDSFYIAMDKHLIPCQANRSFGAFD
ncbi:hypothetical protein SKAU_G00265290 [Synaphobranchus kaupii]|uniref:Uncharacterized protein n=1 Tax=Synaphobranchus kaupii TaxID=118154 RepID=A0A9Q1IP39_SYNKA|nr:hypothetical protein SKAU_G00265290 [Synaphobranchus kaupii]